MLRKVAGATFVAAALVAAPLAQASAHDHVNAVVGGTLLGAAIVGTAIAAGAQPVYAVPAPVYAAPPPVVYAAPAPVYYAAPGYYGPAYYWHHPHPHYYWHGGYYRR